MRVVTCVVAVMLMGLGAAAQDAVLTLTPGENVTGVIAADGTARAALTLDSAGVVVVQVLPVTEARINRLRVLSDDEVVMFSAETTLETPIVTATIPFSDAGTYILEVSGTAGAQFVVSAQIGSVLPPPTPLNTGERVNASIAANAPAKLYRFDAQAFHVLHLSVFSADDAAAPTVVVYAGDARAAVIDGLLGGGLVRIRRGEAAYTVAVLHSGTAGTERFSICVETEDESARCPAYQPPVIIESTAQAGGEAEIIPTPNTGCEARSNVGVLVNVRDTPSLIGLIVATLAADATAPVLGQSDDGIWWEVQVDGVRGWVSGAVTMTAGECTF